MQKIKTLFKIDPITHLLTEEVVEGSEWVINGEGTPYEKFDGTACMIRNNKLYRRFDRKVSKPAPEGWEPCEAEPNKSGHWPGWIPVSESNPQDKWHVEAFKNSSVINPFTDEKILLTSEWIDGTYELVGPKIQGNPYKINEHYLWIHNSHDLDGKTWNHLVNVPRNFSELKEYLTLANNTSRAVFPHTLEFEYFEGIVWHRDNGDMVKIRTKDFKRI